MIKGFLALLLCQLLGELIVSGLAMPVPGAVVGMVLLLLALALLGRVPQALRQSAEGVLSVLPLLLVPPGVGLMVHYQLIAANWIAIGVALLVSTFLTLVLVTALLKWWVSRREHS